jgi:hypothetical protein
MEPILVQFCFSFKKKTNLVVCFYKNRIELKIITSRKKKGGNKGNDGKNTYLFLDIKVIER